MGQVSFSANYSTIRQKKIEELVISERVEGIEPSSSPWKGDVEPLNYTRWSGWWDSNSRPPRPKRGALANCATPRGAEGGSRTRTVGLPPRDFKSRTSACSVTSAQEICLSVSKGIFGYSIAKNKGFRKWKGVTEMNKMSRWWPLGQMASGNHAAFITGVETLLVCLFGTIGVYSLFA